LYFVFRGHQIINCYNLIYSFLQKMSNFLILPIKSSDPLFSVSNLLKSNWVGICWERGKEISWLMSNLSFFCYNWLVLLYSSFHCCVFSQLEMSPILFELYQEKQPISTNYTASLTILSFMEDYCVLEIALSVAGSIKKSSSLLIWTEYLKNWR
jgi:hypothetical protein